jgi:UDP-glucose-4-epimerase GalE
VGDAPFLDRIFSLWRPRAVLHFAAFAYVGESVACPDRYYRNNVAASLVLLDAMRRHDCPTLIFSSSCATYGNPCRVPIPEEHPRLPISPYGRSKMMMEEIIADYGRAYGLRHAFLRYFNAAGADPAGRTGEDHDPETHLIPLILFALSRRRRELEVYGADYDTPDGTAVRDYIHVTDLARAHVLALEKLEETGGPLVVNLGVGRGYSVLEVIRAAAQVTQARVPYSVVGRRAGDPPCLIAAASRAGEVLAWRPVYREIEEIVDHAWRWHRHHHG